MNLMHFFPTLVHSELCNFENGGLNSSDSSSCSITFMKSLSDKFSQELSIKLETGISIIRQPLFFCLMFSARLPFFPKPYFILAIII